MEYQERQLAAPGIPVLVGIFAKGLAEDPGEAGLAIVTTLLRYLVNRQVRILQKPGSKPHADLP